jgi:hypothetical protein
MPMAFAINHLIGGFNPSEKYKFVSHFTIHHPSTFTTTLW